MRRSGSVLLFAVASLALHLGWVLVMPAGERAVRPEERWVEVSYQEEAAPSPAVEEAEPEPQAPVATEAPARPQRVVKKTSPSPTTPTVVEPSPSSMEIAEAAPETPAKAPLSISPRTAALSLDAFALSPALRCAAPGSAGNTAYPRDCAPVDDHGAAVGAAVSRDLKAIAQSIPHLKTREAPKLQRRADGSYAFEGHVFGAVVQPDGHVEFTDDVVKPQLAASLSPFKVVADVNDLVERSRGRELYSAEKAWFLEQTRELREQLASDARRRELQQANIELERTLQQVLGDRSLSVAQKHDAVFLIWQDCGENAQEKAHRRSVEAFVRRYMPRGSEVGFSVEEIERSNAGRHQLQRFDPYAGS